MKLTYEEKVQIYNEWKHEHKSPLMIAREYRLNDSNVKYMVHLADLHGVEKLKHGYTAYTVEFKEEAVKRVLLGRESMNAVSLELGLSNCGILPRWIKEYKENRYTVVEKKRGRHGKEKSNDSSRVRKRSEPLTRRELETADRERIAKKIRSLSYGKKEIRTEEIAGMITELRQEYKCSLKVILDTIHSNAELPQISKSDYYYTVKKKDKDEKNDDLMNMIISIFYGNYGIYGYRRISMELHRRGISVNEKKVRRLMKRMDLKGIRRNARKYHSYKGTIGKIADNLINRNFFAELPDRKWYTDVTEFNLRGVKLYLSPILDGCTGEIISYVTSVSPNLKQTMTMLELAFAKHEHLEGLIMHTDQGWQYQHAAYQAALAEHGIRQSMSRKGNSIDNALMENFFGLLKTEIFYDQEYKYGSLEELSKAIDEYIDYYNNRRIKARLKGMTPIEYRNHALNVA